jgi:hypothetical protein
VASRLLIAVLVCAACAALDRGVAAQQSSAQTPRAASCSITGRITSGSVPIPGASIVVYSGDQVIAATSSDVDGRYAITFAPSAAYHLTAALTAFTAVSRELTLGGPPCDTTVDFQLTLAPRRAPDAIAAAPDRSIPTAPNRPGAPVGRALQTLNVQEDTNGQALVAAGGNAEADTDASALLPAGFTVEAAQADAVAISGSGDATNLDRGQLNDRLLAITRGEFDPASGELPGGAGAGAAGRGLATAFGGPGQGGGRGGGPGPFGGAGGFFGGRGARGQNTYQGTVNYRFGGSALDTPPYELRPDVEVRQPQFAQHTFGATFGGPLKVPRLYKDENRRTNFQLNFTGNQSNNVFDQYATVPIAALRSGDFSSSAIQLFNPTTGQPFAGNQVPVSAASQVLLNFIPLPNLPGAANNFHTSSTVHSASDALSLRLTQNLSPTITQNVGAGFRGGRGGAGVGGRGGGARGRGGLNSNRPTTIILQAQLQVRRANNQTANVFPGLGGDNASTSIAMPVSLNISRGRSVNNFTINVAQTSSVFTNAFAGIENVAGLAGINYPAAAASDPLDWGVPNLTIAGFTGVQSAAATRRTDRRIALGETWMHVLGKHQLRIGGDVRFDRSTSQLNSNARGAFTFTGVYSSDGRQVAGTTGAAFADFLLGLPQQATLQAGGVSDLRGRSLDAFIEDNWQKSSKFTFNVGARYELVWPYTDVHGHLANLDAMLGFASVAPVVAGATGPFSGVFPAGLVDLDANNIGPRLGVAYRPARGTVIRGGYSLTYNPASYASIARELASQPPFASAETVVGTLEAPLVFTNALLASTSSTTNTWAVDRHYQLGVIQTWNVTISHDLSQSWTTLAGYTRVSGSDLDLLSAPNRSLDGTLLIRGVQPFIWESSTGRSTLNSANFQLIRRLARGVAGSASYTLAKSIDDAPSLGSGAPLVAQDPTDLGAEWARSNFDRRQAFSGNLLVELPFGSDRRWLSQGGVLASIVGGWTSALAFTAQSGLPFTARVCGAALDIAQGANCSLRADLTGAPIGIADPSIDRFFDTLAFTVPAAGTFGNSVRNAITGPGSHQLNASLIRDIRFGGPRALTLRVNATNLLNTVEWAAIDTNLNSPTFGQVLAVRPMRTVTVDARFRF